MNKQARVSPRYYLLKKHVLEDLKAPVEFFDRIIEQCPQLLDPNYLGHDEHGHPCKSLNIKSTRNKVTK